MLQSLPLGVILAKSNKLRRSGGSHIMYIRAILNVCHTQLDKYDISFQVLLYFVFHFVFVISENPHSLSLETKPVCLRQSRFLCRLIYSRTGSRFTAGRVNVLECWRYGHCPGREAAGVLGYMRCDDTGVFLQPSCDRCDSRSVL